MTRHYSGALWSSRATHPPDWAECKHNSCKTVLYMGRTWPYFNRQVAIILRLLTFFHSNADLLLIFQEIEDRQLMSVTVTTRIVRSNKDETNQ